MGKQNENGFTIVELLIVLTVIGILIGLIVSVVIGAKDYHYTAPSCDNYSNYSQKDIPARCVKYFNGGQ